MTTIDDLRVDLKAFQETIERLALLQSLDQLAEEVESVASPADTPATVASLVARLVTLGAVEQTRWMTLERKACDSGFALWLEKQGDMPVSVRILILPDAERAL